MLLKQFYFSDSSSEICLNHNDALQNFDRDPNNNHDFCKLKIFPRFQKHPAYHFEHLKP